MSSSSHASTTVRFYPGLDIVLLKEVTAVNPYAQEKNTNEWETIVSNVNSTLQNGRSVTLRGCKDRVKTLMKVHRKQEMQSLKASGTEEEYTERDALLTEVDEMLAESAREREGRRETKADERKKEEQGKEIRDAAMLTLKRKDKNTEENPKRQRRTANFADYIELMREKSTRESGIKDEQLKLQRERFELEKREREQRIERDDLMLQLLKNLTDKD